MRTTHRKPAVYVLTSVLAAFTGLALWGTAMTFGAAGVADPRPAATETVVRAFYFAVNETIRSGDPAPLAEVVADELVVHGPAAAVVPDRAGLERYLASLHATSPDAEIQVEQVVVAGDQAIAYLAVHGGEQADVAGIPLAGRRAVWGTVDALRVVGHRVVEHWPGAGDLALMEPVQEFAPDPALAGEQALVLDRVILPPAARFESPGNGDVRLVYVESGAVEHTAMATEMPAASFNRAAILAYPPAGPPPSAPAPTGTLAAGDFVAVSSWTNTALRNTDVASASLLIVSVTQPDGNGRLPSSIIPYRPDRPQPPDAVGGGIGQNRTFDDGAVLQPLAGGVVTTMPEGPAVVAIGRMTLAPGAALPAFETAGPLLLTVDRGALGLSAAGDMAWVNRGVRGWSTHMEHGEVRSGHGAFLHAGTAVALQAHGSEPVVVTVVSVLPKGPAG